MSTKNFFDNLSPKSALIVGVVSGVLVLCTIGFMVMLGMFLSEKTIASQDGGELTAVEAKDFGLPKTDKPNVELFIMTHCPYGLQMQKAYLPVYDLLKDKADMQIKFVYYVMHGLPEVQEETRQYCIQKEQTDKYSAYADCFSKTGDTQTCLTATGVDEAKMNVCYNKTDAEYGIIASYEDQASWLSGHYPLYPIYNADNEKYEVQGSPTLIINGEKASVDRSPEMFKQAVCSSFTSPPEECSTVLSSAPASAGFGTGVGTATNASCE